MRNKYFIKIIAYLLFMFLTSCRQEDVTTAHVRPAGLRNTGDFITFKDFQKETLKNFADVSQVIEKYALGNGTSTFSNKEKSNWAYFDIDTTYIRMMQYQNDFKSFSIRAFRKGENPDTGCYNIIFHKKNEEWKADIFKLSYTREFLNEYQNNVNIPFGGIITHLRTPGKSAHSKTVYDCTYSVVPMCYCANHTPENCKGCDKGFRNVGVWDCSEAGGEGSGGGSTTNPYYTPPAYPPFNDQLYGSSTSPNPYTQGSLEFGNNLPVFDDPVYLQNMWNYHLWEALGSEWIYGNYGTYTLLQAFHIKTKGQNLQLISNLVSNNSSNIQFIDWAAQFLTAQTDDQGICAVSWTQFQNWFMEGNINFNYDLLQLLVQNNYVIPQYNLADYPGKNDNMPFNWWSDDNYLNNNFSLSIENGYEQLTKEEKKLVKIFPKAAYAIYLNKDDALSFAQNNFPNLFQLNDKADAFRHAFFNAINVRDVFTTGIFSPPIIVRLFANAHESEVPSNLILEKQMDLFNNEIGINFCLNCIPIIDSNNSIKDGIINLLNKGQLKYLKPINYSGIQTDPTFWDNPNTPIPNDGHHGITSSTQLIFTNQ